jgi:hypothetical protein
MVLTASMGALPAFPSNQHGAGSRTSPIRWDLDQQQQLVLPSLTPEAFSPDGAERT